MMRRLTITAAAIASLLHASGIAFAPIALASVQEDTICWDPDVEFPIECNEDGDDE